MLEILEFADEHLAAAAALLEARHTRHRTAEPLLPSDVDFRGELEREWRADGASGVFASRGGTPVGYLLGRPLASGGSTWLTVGIAGHALDGDPEIARDLYAAAAERWHREGQGAHAVYVPAADAALVDAWFRLSFGASGAYAMRETARSAGDDDTNGDVTIRTGRPDDIDDAARLEAAMDEALIAAPSFSDLPAQSLQERLEEWQTTWSDERFEHFVAERGGAVVGHILLYRRPADLRVPRDSIDLGAAATAPECRGTGVGRALTAHVLAWAREQDIPVMTIDWRMTNLYASRFWPRRGFRESFLRLYRRLP